MYTFECSTRSRGVGDIQISIICMAGLRTGIVVLAAESGRWSKVACDSLCKHLVCFVISCFLNSFEFQAGLEEVLKCFNIEDLQQAILVDACSASTLKNENTLRIRFCWAKHLPSHQHHI